MNNQQRDQPQNNIFYIPRLSEYADAISRVMHELKNIGASPEQIISLLKGDGRPPGNTDTDEMKVEVDIEMEVDIPAVPASPVKYPRRMYTAYQIARELGIYSMYGRPHAHAVSAVLNNMLSLDDEHYEERLLFETGNVTVTYAVYDKYALERVRKWLFANNLPTDVEGYCYTYHFLYK